MRHAGPGGGGATATAGPGGGATPTIDPFDPFGGGLGRPTMRPSGARFRVVNGYATPPAGPTAIDVYAGHSAAAGQQPLVTVPFGGVSDWFDSGVFDEDGNAALSYYPAGKRTIDDNLITKTETLQGDERVTAFLSAADTKTATGVLFGRIEMLFETGVDFALGTPPPGKSLLFVDAVGAQNLVDKERLWYVSTGGKCLPEIDFSTGVGPQPVSPGTRAEIRDRPRRNEGLAPRRHLRRHRVRVQGQAGGRGTAVPRERACEPVPARAGGRPPPATLPAHRRLTVPAPGGQCVAPTRWTSPPPGSTSKYHRNVSAPATTSSS